MRQYYFISGLPRSGTTLLSTILNQNPKFSASISGPLARFARAVVDQSNAQGGYKTECPPEKTKKIITGIFNNYYDDPNKEICWNTNRGWMLLLPMLKDLFPQTKVIACVRDVPWILDSFETLVRKNPYSTSSLFPADANINVYTRCRYLMNESSPLGFAYNALKHGITSAEKPMVMLVDYSQLCMFPQSTMQAIYKFVGQPYFEHDFNNVEASYDEFDSEVNLPGLHTTRKQVEWIPRETILPPDIIQAYSGLEVWK
jgi:sulfotransferase